MWKVYISEMPVPRTSGKPPSTKAPTTPPPNPQHKTPQTTSPVPSWVPFITANNNADVYPVPLALSPSSNSSSTTVQAPELVLDASSLADGYSAKRPQYEFSSLRNDADANDEDGVFVVDSQAFRKLVRGGRMLRGIGGEGRVVIDDGMKGVGGVNGKKGKGKKGGGGKGKKGVSGDGDNAGGIVGEGKRLFPLQKPSSAKGLEEWMDRLASEEVDVAELARAVPLGPAIVRAVGKVLMMMFERDVPVQRATWYIRVAVLNECFKQIRPDRPVPSPRLFWTGKLSGFVKSEWELLKSPKWIKDKEGLDGKMRFLIYVLRIARWQADEGVIDNAGWVKALGEFLKLDLMGKVSTESSRAFLVIAVEMFLFEILESPAATLDLTRTIVRFLDQFVSSHAQPAEITNSAGGSIVAKSVAEKLNPQLQKIMRILVACMNCPVLNQKASLSGNIMSMDELRRVLTAGKEALANVDNSFSSTLSSQGLAYPRKIQLDLSLSAFHTQGDMTMIISLLPREPRAAALMVVSWALKSCLRNLYAPLTAATVLAKLSYNQKSLPALAETPSQVSRVKYRFHREIWCALKAFKHNPTVCSSVSRLLAHFVSRELVNVTTLISDIGSLLHQASSDPDTEQAKQDRLVLKHCAQYLFQLPKSYDKRTGDLMKSLFRRLKNHFPDMTNTLNARDGARKLPSLTYNLVAVAEAQEMTRTEPVGVILDIARRLRKAYIEERSKSVGSERQFSFIPVIIFLTICGSYGEGLKCLLFETKRNDSRPEEVCFIASSMISVITACGAKQAVEDSVKYRTSKRKVRHRRAELLRQALSSGSRLDGSLLADSEYRFSLGELIGDVLAPTLKSIPDLKGSQGTRDIVLGQVKSLMDSPDYHPFTVLLHAKRVAELQGLVQISKLDAIVKNVVSYGDATLGVSMGKSAVSRIFPPLSESIMAQNIADAEVALGGVLSEFYFKPPADESTKKIDGVLTLNTVGADALVAGFEDVFKNGISEDGSNLASVVSRSVDSKEYRMLVLKASLKAGSRLLSPGEEESGDKQKYESDMCDDLPGWLSFIAHFGKVASIIPGEIENSSATKDTDELWSDLRSALVKRMQNMLERKLESNKSSKPQLKVASRLDDIVGALKVVLSGADGPLEAEEAKSIAMSLGRATRSPAVIERLYFMESTEEAEDSGTCLEHISGTLRVLRKGVDEKKWVEVAQEFLKQSSEAVSVSPELSLDLKTLPPEHRFRMMATLGEEALNCERGSALTDAGVRHPVRAYNKDGVIDNWQLLEGMGKNPEEQAALHPELFGIQEDRSVPDSPPPVRLKRTYSAFAHLVR